MFRFVRRMSTCIDPSNNPLRPGEFRGSSQERNQQLERLSGILDRLERKELPANAHTYMSLLRMSAALGSLASGIRIHEQVSTMGLEGDSRLGNLLLQMYVKNGRIDLARRLMTNKSQWGVILWTTAMAAYAQKGHLQEALHLFQEMLLEACARPDGVVYVTVLGACTEKENLAFGKTIHTCICEDEVELTNPLVNAALMNMYARCGSLEDARRVFDSVERPNVVMYTTMIAGYAELEHERGTAIQLFRRMQQDGVLPDKISLVATLNACGGGSTQDLHLGRLIHECVMESGLESHTVVATALVNLYGKSGCLEKASSVFRKLQRKDSVAWAAMLTACSKTGSHHQALKIFAEMNLEGVRLSEVGFFAALEAFGCPEALTAGKKVHGYALESGLGHSVLVGNAAIRMYGRCGSLKDSWEVFSSMVEKDVSSWTCICCNLVQDSHFSNVLLLYKQMQLDGIRPDKCFLSHLLQACAVLPAAAEGRLVHARIKEAGYKCDTVLGLSLINMYVRCGNLTAAKDVFDSMAEREEERAALLWTTILSGYAHHGHSDQAFLTFWRMQQDGAMPDSITLLSILSVCSQAGLVEKGCDYFMDISREYKLDRIEKHFGCMIDLLGRSGDLGAAEEMILKKPFEQSATNWIILLAACKVHGDTERGRRAAKRILELEPSPTAYVILSNIHAAAGELDEVERVRKEMRELGFTRWSLIRER